MKTPLILVGLTFGISCFAQKTLNLSLASPPSHVSIFGEGTISSFLNERDFTISPDGTEVYFTITTPKSSIQSIVFSKKLREGVWTLPEIVSFSGKFSDLEPAFGPDGKTLFFASNRPLSGDTAKDFDIWKVTRNGSTWGNPENLGSIINSDGDEFYPSLAKNGNIYFTATYSHGVGKEDIFLSQKVDNAYQKPVPLDTALNSKAYEFNAFISPDEDYILFSSFGRPGDTGRGDMYMSMKDANGRWTKAVNLKNLNSAALDYCPYVSPDGQSFFFTSERHALPASFNPKATYQKMVDTFLSPLNGNGNIYWIQFSKVKSFVASTAK